MKDDNHLPLSMLPPKFATHTAADMAALADNLWKAQQRLKAAQEKLRPLEDTVDALEAELLDAMLASKLESVASKKATVSVKRNQFVELFDDKEFFTYVRRKNAFDLVRKQPVLSACQARWEDNVTVPGVRPGTKTTLSVTTRRK